VRKTTILSASIPIIAFAIIVLAISGCQQKRSVVELSDAEIKAAAEKREEHVDKYARSMWAESKLPPEQAKKIKKEMEKGFEKSLEVWLSVTDDPDDFKKGMTGSAFEELKQQFTNELAQGKIKVRVHDSQVFEAVKIDEESGAIAYAYTDNGYYIDAKTKKKISKPLNEKKEWLISVAKVKNVWKISGIYPLRPNTGPEHMESSKSSD